MDKQLRKSIDRRVWGVCGGLARYFDMDPTLVRFVWLMATLVGLPFTVLAYIVLAIIMPD